MLRVVVGALIFIALFYGGMYAFARSDYGSAGALKVAGIATGSFVGALFLIPLVARKF